MQKEEEEPPCAPRRPRQFSILLPSPLPILCLPSPSPKQTSSTPQVATPPPSSSSLPPPHSRQRQCPPSHTPSRHSNYVGSLLCCWLAPWEQYSACVDGHSSTPHRRRWVDGAGRRARSLRRKRRGSQRSSWRRWSGLGRGRRTERRESVSSVGCGLRRNETNGGRAEGRSGAGFEVWGERCWDSRFRLR